MNPFAVCTRKRMHVFSFSTLKNPVYAPSSLFGAFQHCCSVVLIESVELSCKAGRVQQGSDIQAIGFRLDWKCFASRLSFFKDFLLVHDFFSCGFVLQDATRHTIATFLFVAHPAPPHRRRHRLFAFHLQMFAKTRAFDLQKQHENCVCCSFPSSN